MFLADISLLLNIFVDAEKQFQSETIIMMSVIKCIRDVCGFELN